MRLVAAVRPSYPPTHPPTHPSTHLPTHPPTFLSTHPLTHLLSKEKKQRVLSYLPTHPPTHLVPRKHRPLQSILPIFQPTHPPTHPPTQSKQTQAKVRRAQEAVLSTRPFNEGLQSVFSGLVKRLALENIELPLLQVRPTHPPTPNHHTH